MASKAYVCMSMRHKTDPDRSMSLTRHVVPKKRSSFFPEKRQKKLRNSSNGNRGFSRWFNSSLVIRKRSNDTTFCFSFPFLSFSSVCGGFFEDHQPSNQISWDAFRWHIKLVTTQYCLFDWHRWTNTRKQTYFLSNHRQSKLRFPRNEYLLKILWSLHFCAC